MSIPEGRTAQVRPLFRLLAKLGCGIDDRRAGPGGQPLQVAALPFELDAGGAPRFLLITSRSSGRWIIPKGWPVRGLTLPESAAREAYEEAGVRGEAGATELGRLTAGNKPGRGGRGWAVIVYPLPVRTVLPKWREQGQRDRRWVVPAEATALLGDSDLGRMLAGIDIGALAAAADRPG
jgi:8-oxo-dGTP pyrophosphatase MutT (NUDIX family)